MVASLGNGLLMINSIRFSHPACAGQLTGAMMHEEE